MEKDVIILRLGGGKTKPRRTLAAVLVFLLPVGLVCEPYSVATYYPIPYASYGDVTIADYLETGQPSTKLKIGDLSKTLSKTSEGASLFQSNGTMGMFSDNAGLSLTPANGYNLELMMKGNSAYDIVLKYDKSVAKLDGLCKWVGYDYAITTSHSIVHQTLCDSDVNSTWLAVAMGADYKINFSTINAAGMMLCCRIDISTSS